MTLHGLRATVITQLFGAGMDDASVAKRSGHRDMRSFASYTNLRGSLGKRQQQGILGGFEESKAKRTVSLVNSSCGEGNGQCEDRCVSEKENSELLVATGNSIGSSGVAGINNAALRLPTFLQNQGSLNGNVTINVNFGVGAGKIGPGCGEGS
ncbi:DNA breaking-rejoining enzyme [Gracilaria domingensis]|nr:DNA breaking-rejoining enzyme [Gracilaria domingensis]